MLILKNLLLTLTSIFVIFLVFLSLPIIFFSKFFGRGCAIGVVENCENIYNCKLSLNKYFKKLITVAIKDKFFLHLNYDFVLNNHLTRIGTLNEIFIKLKLLKIFFILIFNCNKFIFYWNRTYLPLNIDLIIFKLLNKKVIIFHIGSDVRVENIQNQIFKNYFKINYKLPETDNQNIKFIKSLYHYTIIKNLNIDLFTDIETETFLDTDAHKFLLCHNFKNFKLDNKHQKCVKIIHAPSDSSVKRTDLVLKIVDKLKNNSGIDFDFKLIKNLDNSSLIEELKNSDILIDQPFLGPAKLALEAIDCKCIVISGSYDFCKSNFYKDSPVIPFLNNIDEVCDHIISLKEICDRMLLSEKLRNWAINKYSVENFGEKIYSCLIGKKEKDLYPIKGIKSYLIKYSDAYWKKILIKILIKNT